MADAPPDLSRLHIERGPAAKGGRAGLIVLVVVLLGVVAWQAWPRLAALRDERPVVELGVARRVGGAQAVSGTAANGYVVARRQASLSTDIQGRLVELRVEEGDRVGEGDLVARLDTRQLEASLARTRADLKTAAAAAERARLDYERKAPLLATGDVSQNLVDVARTALDEAEAKVNSLEAWVRETQVMIDKSSVYAPFAGVITAKNAEVGEVVSSIASGGNSRGSVATLVDFDTLEVQVELAQTSLQAAREGAPVQIFLDAFPEDGYAGRVRQIWPTADRQKATVELRAEFLERDERILPEMGVRVVFVDDDVTAPAEVEVRVPERALRRDGSGQSVFVFAAGAVTRRSITLQGEPDAGWATVAEGLSGSERLVLDPPPDLVDGDEVREAEGDG